MEVRRLSRRRLLAGLGATAVAVLAACAPSPAPTPAPAEQPKPGATPTPAPAPEVKPLLATPTPVPTLAPVPYKGGTKLLLRVHWSGVYFNDFQKIINEYNSTQGEKDKIYVELQRFVAGQAGPIATYIADFQAGTQEDIYHLNDAYFADLASRGFFRPPPPEIQSYIKENWLETAVRAGIWEGKIMGYPTENQTMAVFINKKMAQEVGLDPEKSPPRTWEEQREWAKKLTKIEGGKKLRAGFVWHDANGERQFVQRVVMHWLNGEDFVDTSVTPPKVNIATDIGRMITEYWYKLAEDGSLSADLGQAPQVWGNRLGAINWHESFAVYFVLVTQGQPGILEEQHTLVPFSADGSKRGSNTRNYHFLVSAKTKYPDECWKFLRWLNDGPEFRMQKFQTDVFGFVPSVKGYKLPDFFPAQMKEAYKKALENTTPMPVVRGLAQLYNILRDNQDALVLKKVKPAEAVQKMDQEFKQALKEAYSS